jgi:hypothetical protein
MKAELAEAKKQLNIQIQVNSEVKKLLVASVGEDIEAKVDFLTQDKADCQQIFANSAIKSPGILRKKRNCLLNQICGKANFWPPV